jgi:hypothetical protein
VGQNSLLRHSSSSPSPAAGPTSRASPPGHAAWHPFPARTPIYWKPPPGCTTSATPGLALTGLHQLDGARYLRDAQHADALLCRLVAHHSCAIIEVGERGLSDVLNSEFDPAPDVPASVLTCCDMTTSPDGQPVPVERRLAEIYDSYGSGQLVSRSIRRATPMILCAVEQVHQRAAQTT